MKRVSCDTYADDGLYDDKELCVKGQRTTNPDGTYFGNPVILLMTLLCIYLEKHLKTRLMGRL